MESTVVIVNRETDLDAVRAARLPTAEMLSLSVRGIDMGSPWATISHVEVGTVESACFIFDVADLQLVETPSPAALALLKAFLETSGIAKVVHDSRAPSDVLYRQCNILLRNVHDTQVWWSVLSSGDELHLASFNDTLISYGCAPVPPRDESALAETPAFWATRPITDEMQGWAVQEMEALFRLQAAQNRLATPAQEGRCYAESCVNLARFRDAYSDVVYVHASQLGPLIGSGGAHIRALEHKTGTEFMIRDAPRAFVVVYAPSKKTLAAAIAELQSFTLPAAQTVYASARADDLVS